MDTILLIILVILLGATISILYLNIKSKPKVENKDRKYFDVVESDEGE